MHTFTDKKTREWSLELDVWLVEQIHKKVKEVTIDKLLANKAAGLEELFSDRVLFVRVLWVIVEEQAQKKGVEPESFGRALGGDALEDASEAFLRALADFCPRQQRAVLKALLARGKEITEEQLPKVLEEIAEFRPGSSTPVTSAPASSEESTPTVEG